MNNNNKEYENNRFADEETEFKEKYRLGSINSSEQLISDLYINLRKKVSLV